MKIALIYNPVAGALRWNAKRLERCVEILLRQGHKVVVHPTTAPETAGAIARECIAEGAQTIAVAGGDGTINEAAEGMIGSAVPLAALPAGTANVLCMELGLGKNMERVAERLAVCRPVRIAVGRLTAGGIDGPRHFLLMAGVGLDALVVSRLNPVLKRRTGKFAYWVAGFSVAGSTLAEFDVRVDGAARRASFALASRVRNYGGDLEIAHGASLLSREFEVVLFEGANSFRYVKYLAGVLVRRAERLKGVSVLRGRSMEIERASGGPVHIQVDGELVGQLPVRIEILDDALTLMMPPEYR